MKIDFSIGIAKTDRDDGGFTTISHSNPADNRFIEERFNFREIADLTVGSSHVPPAQVIVGIEKSQSD
jgi:hypothetical protein